MTIHWLGGSALKIQTKENLLIVDPFVDQAKTKFPRLKAEIALTTNPKDDCCGNVRRLQGDPFVIDNPGEYEVGGTTIYGAQGGRENDGANIIYTVKSEGMHLGLLGALGHDMSKKQLVTVEDVDVLFVPVHGNPMKRLTDIISIIEPRIIVPVMYASKAFPSHDSVDGFLKEMGVKDKMSEDKLALKASDLPQEEIELILLHDNA